LGIHKLPKEFVFGGVLGENNGIGKPQACKNEENKNQQEIEPWPVTPPKLLPL
jgi:hypothetical protein